MYYLPEEYETASFSADFNEEEVNAIDAEFQLDNDGNDFHDANFVQIVNIVQPNWDYPNNVQEAQDLYVAILDSIKAFENNA